MRFVSRIEKNIWANASLCGTIRNVTLDFIEPIDLLKNHNKHF